jgi:hypothetical protein
MSVRRQPYEQKEVAAEPPNLICWSRRIDRWPWRGAQRAEDEEARMPNGKRGSGQPKADDAQHRKFREALERKKAKGVESAAHAERTRHTGVGEAHNDHQQRQFRRKSG